TSASVTTVLRNNTRPDDFLKENSLTMKAPDRFHTTIKTSALSLIAITTIISILFLSAIALAQNARQATRENTQQSKSSASIETTAPVKTAQASIESGNTANVVSQSPGPDLVTTTSYPFTSATGISLEDMSSGTTQL